MPGTPTTRLSLPTMAGATDIASTIDNTYNAAQAILDAAALYQSGVFASRPVATAVPAGTIYRPTDVAGCLFLSDGTAWRTFALDSQGTLASRPTAAIAGRLYYATDTGQLFRDTGSTWSDLIAGVTAPYRTIATVSAFVPGSAPMNQLLVCQDGSVISSSFSGTKAPVCVPVALADHAVPGLTTKFRLRAFCSTNATAPGTGLNASVGTTGNASGVSGQYVYSLGTLYGTTLIASPAASTLTVATGADFTLSGDQNLSFLANPLATTAAASYTLITWQLQVHNV